MKILLVDDDSFLRDMYATKFKEGGHAVASAESGEKAIQQLEKETYDVILLDLVMPGLTGLELLKKIKDENLGGSPKCIVLSNQGEQKDIDEAMAAGAAGYIVKAEMIPSEVVSRVENLISP